MIFQAWTKLFEINRYCAGSYSRKLAQEGARILQALGCEVRMFDPTGLPLPGIEGADQDPKVLELRDLATWSERMVWSSPERHGAMSGIIKLQIYWLPLSMGGRPAQDETLVLMQVCGGTQSFNALNQMRILGR